MIPYSEVSLIFHLIGAFREHVFKQIHKIIVRHARHEIHNQITGIVLAVNYPAADFTPSFQGLGCSMPVIRIRHRMILDVTDMVPVKQGMKSGDVDPRDDAAYCHTSSDKALAVAGGVLEAILHLRVRNDGK